jgi:hypothetical protein
MKLHGLYARMPAFFSIFLFCSVRMTSHGLIFVINHCNLSSTPGMPTWNLNWGLMSR